MSYLRCWKHGCFAVLCLKSCFFGFQIDAVGDFAFLQDTPVSVCTSILPAQHGSMAACNAWRMLQRAACMQMSHTCKAASAKVPLVCWWLSTAGVATFHLHQHLCLQPPAGLMLTCNTPYTLFTCATKTSCWLQELGFSCLPSSCQLQECMLLAATNGYAACMESHCWLADTFHRYALFGAVKSWSCTYLAHHQPESVNIVVVLTVHVVGWVVIR